MSAAPASRARLALLALALFAAAVGPYLATLSFPFLSYDDPDYVTRNPWVQDGLTLDGLRWACTAAHASNWHPLTWLAHMLDVELFGPRAGGHHAASVLLHGVNAALCFLALCALTRRTLLALGVALLFAVHPLRVESVAWVSERKDVLSGLFFFLLLLAYAGYARAPSVGRYLVALLCLALGLAAKPMLVSAPLVLLVLDLFVLHRGERGLARLALEKLPFVALALGSALLTVHAQRAGGALNTLEFLPLEARLANAPIAALTYLGHFFWPEKLAYFYPHRALAGAEPRAFDAVAWLALATLLGLVTLAWRLRRRAALVTAGFLWFLVMLGPVIGIVQVGEQALADRYAYLPLVGIQLALLGALPARFPASPRSRRLAVALLVLLALGLAQRTRRQVDTWRDSRTLYEHALAVTERNYPAHVGLATELAAVGERAGARAEQEAALALRPDYAPALYGLGLLAQEDGRRDEAIELYRKALASLPGLAAAELNLGGLLAQSGNVVGAAQCFERVLALDPEHADARTNLAQLLFAMGEPEAARVELERVVAVHPAHGAAWVVLGELAEARGDHVAALAALERGLAGPRRLDAARLLCWILASAAEPELREPARALGFARELAAAGRADPPALEAQAAALAANGEFERAAAALAEAGLGLSPGARAGLETRAALYRQGKLYLHAH
jgi:tetratricopeptide (TPR) repeat protein